MQYRTKRNECSPKATEDTHTIIDKIPKQKRRLCLRKSGMGSNHISSARIKALVVPFGKECRDVGFHAQETAPQERDLEMKIPKGTVTIESYASRMKCGHK